MRQINYILLLLLMQIILLNSAWGADIAIKENLDSIQVIHRGKTIKIMRNQDPEHTVNPKYAKTSRKCPPFCIQPIQIAEGVETIGELEVLDYLDRMYHGDNSILVIDSRTEDWVKDGTIPGSINIPWTTLNTDAGADPFTVEDLLLQKFGVKKEEGLWNFNSAKTLVLFCNGMWCGQSPSSIHTLLRLGYPPGKLKWYRGGMQDWEILGLTVIGDE